MGCFPTPDPKTKSRPSPPSDSEPSHPNRNGSSVSPPSSPASLLHHRHSQLSRSRSTHTSHSAGSIDIRRSSPGGIDLGCSSQSFGTLAFHALKHGHKTAHAPPPNSLRRVSSCNKHHMKKSAADPLQVDPKRSSSLVAADGRGQEEENSRVIFHSAPLSAEPDRMPKLNNTRPFFFPLPLPPSAASHTADDSSSQSLSTTTTSTPSSSSSSSSSVRNSSPNKANNHVTLTSHSWALHSTDLQPNPPPLPLPLPPDIVPLREYTFDELAGACLNFAAEFYIRNGGLGPVYRATLRHALQDEEALVVAVTKLSGSHPQSFKKWRGEVELVACLPHPNLSRLLGFTGEDPSTTRTTDQNNAAALQKDRYPGHQRARLLVFEHTSNGSLDSLLYCRNGKAPLDWAKRLRIATGAAEGLAFLHDRMPKQIIYKVFKTSNIEVDDGFNAKLSDFGFTRSCKEIVSTSEETLAADAYAAPEILASPPPADREAWVKSHVWSFGVVLLELLTGRQNKDALFPPEERNLVEWCRPYMLDSKKLYLVMDPELKGRYPTKAAKTVADLALLCLTDDPTARPSMKNVADVLSSQIKPKLFHSYERGRSDERQDVDRSKSQSLASPGRTPPPPQGYGRRWRRSMRQRGEQPQPQQHSRALLERFLWSGDQVMAGKGSGAACHRHVFLSGEATG